MARHRWSSQRALRLALLSAIVLGFIVTLPAAPRAASAAPPQSAIAPVSCPEKLLFRETVLSEECATATRAGGPSAATAQAAVESTDFQDEIAIGGLTAPTAVRFLPDGRVFVAEKSGLIKVFDSLTDTTPTIFADLRTNVHNFWDRGLLGLALAPNFAANPYVYVLYTHDAAIGGTAPRWGTVGGTSDGCPNPPGATGDGCVVSGRLSRLQAAGNVMTGAERVLVEDWCQQYPSHTVGSLAFGADGALYVSAGDGASFNFTDYGQDGSPLNPCGDPPGGSGATLTPPTAEGGALRSQDVRTAGDPTGLDGAILRLDPNTGAALPGNPLYGSADQNARRIVAHGLRNPFRLTARPGANEVWFGDVGWGAWEEIGRVADPTAATATNFGWPCYEGNGRQSGYDGADLTLCETLYSQGVGAVAAPYYTYSHTAKVVAGETCGTGSSSISGLAFYQGGAYPAEYNGALFFADYSRDCIWAMKVGANGLPDPANRATFVAGASNPVELQTGPNGDLFYVDLDGGAIHRIRYVAGSVPTACPTGQWLARYYNTTTPGGTPALTRCETSIDYDWGSGSPAPGVFADKFSVRWTGTHRFDDRGYTFTARADDGIRVWLDGVSVIDEWRDQSPTQFQATRDVTAGEHEVTVEYYENVVGAVAQVSWQPVGRPFATIATPGAGPPWKVGDTIAFSGSATDPEDGPLPASALSWSLILHHCPSNCHTHPVETFDGVASGSFVAPDHEHPSHLELRLTATDSGGLNDVSSVLLYPQAVTLTFQAEPAGLQLTVGSATQATPFTRNVIVGSANSVSAPTPQTLGGVNYAFASWSDGGAPTHNFDAPSSARTYTAAFTALPPPQRTLDLSVSGAGTVIASPTGPTYPLDAPVTLTAAPAAGHVFAGWIVDGVAAGSANPLALTMNANHAVVATFAPVPPPPPPTYALALSATPGGAVSGSAPGAYPAGTTVTLTAAPAAGHTFAGWTLDGVAAGSANPLSLLMSANRAVVATFAAIPPPPPPPPPTLPSDADCSAWSCWASLEGRLTDAPAAAGHNGRVYVFAKGSDDALYVKSSADGKTFGGWTNLEGKLTAAPAATSHGGRLYVFAKGSDDALYVKNSADGKTFGGWTSLGGKLTAPPTAASVNGNLYVFAKGSDDALYVKTATSGTNFGGWTRLGGLLTAAPAATGFGGQVYVFAKGSDDALYLKRSRDGRAYTEWERLGGQLTAAPVAASAGRTLYVLARGSDGALYEQHTTGGAYTQWKRLGGPVVGPPAAAGAGNRLFVFARGEDDALWERHTPR